MTLAEAMAEHTRRNPPPSPVRYFVQYQWVPTGFWATCRTEWDFNHAISEFEECVRQQPDKPYRLLDNFEGKAVVLRCHEPSGHSDTGVTEVPNG